MLEVEDQPEEKQMARLPEITELSGKQLNQLIESAEKLLKQRKATKIQEYRDKIAAELGEEGISIAEVFGTAPKPRGRPKGDGSRSPAKMKYRLPDGTEWSGKGRLPVVLRDALKGAEGYSENDASFDSKEARAKALEKYLI